MSAVTGSDRHAATFDMTLSKVGGLGKQMFRKILLGSFSGLSLAAALVVPAGAADVNVKAVPGLNIPIASWSGFYVGAVAGIASDKLQTNVFCPIITARGQSRMKIGEADIIATRW